MARKTATVADLTSGVEDDPLLPGFEMSDEPFEPAVPEPVAPDLPTPIVSPDLPSTLRYQSRIHIVDAWQYPGNLTKAPDFVDRNWASWGDYDEFRKLPAGPALRVATPGPVAQKMCRIGDFVVRQSVTLAVGLPAEEQIDVWTREEFERLFVPSREPASEDAA